MAPPSSTLKRRVAQCKLELRHVARWTDFDPVFPEVDFDVASDSLHLVGLCRFSYPTGDGSGFAVKSGVGDLDRLRTRMTLFKKLWVPAMLGQTDKRFTIIVLIGSSLPDEIRTALVDAVSDCPQIVIHEEADGQIHNEVCNKVLRLYRRSDVDFIGEFGLDDDDTVSLDFIAEVHRHFRALQPLVLEAGRAELDFSRGYAARISESSCVLKEVVAPHWNCGQVIFQKSPSRLSLFHFHHYRFWKKHPCLLATRRPMFIRSFHANNDSGDRWERFKAEGGRMDPRELAALVAKSFGISICADADGGFQIF